MKAELWDLYDKNRMPTGRTHVRGGDLPAGTYHIVVEVWTVNPQGQILLTLRSPKKETYPDKWECTGGSVLAGETSLAGAVRELFEETGITAEESELTLLYSDIGKSDSFYDIYILHRDISLEKLTMQEGETAAAKWVTISDLYKMIDADEIAAPIAKRFVQVKDKILEYINCL